LAVLNNWSPPRVSQLLVDADLTIPAAYDIRCNKIRGYDSELWLSAATSASWEIRIVHGGTYINGSCRSQAFQKDGTTNPPHFPYGLKTPSIGGYGSVGIIDILESVALAAGKSVSVDSLLTDGISERTGSAGVSVLDVLEVDHIAEQTASAGITFDDDLNIDTDFEAKVTQRYRSASAGDTLRYGDATEVFYNTPGASPGEILKQVTIPDVYLDASCTFRISFTAKKTSVGAAYASVWINGIERAPSVLTLTTDYQVKSTDIGSLTGGDVITVHVYGVGAQDMYIKDFTVKSTDSVYTPLAASPIWSP